MVDTSVGSVRSSGWCDVHNRCEKGRQVTTGGVDDLHRRMDMTHVSVESNESIEDFNFGSTLDSFGHACVHGREIVRMHMIGPYVLLRLLRQC